MIEQTGTVIDTDATSLWVEPRAVSGCSSCGSAAGSCSTAVVSKLFAERRTRLQLPNSLAARTGDQVVIGIPESLLVRAALWAYLLPLLLMVGAALTVQQLGGTEGMQGLWGVAGLMAGFAGLRFRSRSACGGTSIQPRLLRFADQDQPVVLKVPLPSRTGVPEQGQNSLDNR